MDVIDLYKILFRAALGRSPSDTEIDAIVARYGDADIEPEVVGAEILKSEEFFIRHRDAFVRWQFPRSTIVTARGPLGHQIHVDLRQLHLGLSMACGHYEPTETAFVQKHVCRGMSVLDVGANIGYFTTMFAGLVGDGGRVIALEPVNDSYLKLTSAVHLNQQEACVELHNVAASSSEGMCQLSYDVDSLNMGGVSMRPTDSKALHMITQTARTRRIDDIVGGRPVHFIKMDIEGAEGLAIGGALETITRFRPVIMMEFNEAQLLQVSGMSAAALFNQIADLGFIGRKLIANGETAPTSSEEVSQATSSGRILNIAFLPEL